MAGSALLQSRVLVVDDEPLLRRMIVRRLKQVGYTVDQANDAETALPLAASSTYDVALVDYNMPGRMHGLELLALIRDLQPSCMRILMTGHCDFPVVVDAVNRGEIVRVLTKPFDVAILDEAVEHALLQSRNHAYLQEGKRELAGLDRMFQELIEQDMLRMAVQPIVDAQYRRPRAVECLLRSSHPVLASPLSVLRTAERAGHIPALGRLVNQRAAAWAARLPEEILIFVNVHPAQLGGVGFFAGFEPLVPYAHRVIIEVTERTLLQDVANWDEAIQELGHAGFRFAVDDLGSGHNGLQLLAELKPAFIKVDMGIVRHVDREPRKQRLITLLVDFANSTGANLVAEGVEDEHEARTLITCGAHLLQGYHFGRPTLDGLPAAVPATAGAPGLADRGAQRLAAALPAILE